MPDYAPPITAHLGLPLPSPDAPDQRQDVGRIGAALTGLDAAAGAQAAALETAATRIEEVSAAGDAANEVITAIGARCTLWCGMAGGTANALTVTPPVALSALYDGLTVRFVVPAANTDAVTLTVGAAPLKPLRDPVGAVLAAGGVSPALVATATYVAAAEHWRLSWSPNTMTAFLRLSGGTLTGGLQTYSGVGASLLGLRIGEAVSGFYRSAAGVVGFVAAGVEVFRTAATGVLTIFKAVRGAPVTVTDAATVTLNLDTGNNFDWTVGGNRTLGNPTNIVAGQSGRIVIRWSGAYTISVGSYWKPAGTQTFDAGAGKINRVQWEAVSATEIHYTILKGF